MHVKLIHEKRWESPADPRLIRNIDWYCTYFSHSPSIVPAVCHIASDQKLASIILLKIPQQLVLNELY